MLLHEQHTGSSYFWKINIPKTAAKETRSAVTHIREYSSGLCKQAQDVTFTTEPADHRERGVGGGLLTMIQTGEGTLLRTCGASEDTDDTPPPHHSSEKSHGSLTVCTVTLMLL